jgi:hypothetical protein
MAREKAITGDLKSKRPEGGSGCWPFFFFYQGSSARGARLWPPFADSRVCSDRAW